jgi:phosphoglycerate dehydrogenase-like enzyme
LGHPTLFLTERSERQQQSALAAAPVELSVTMRRNLSREGILRLIPEMEFLISERSGAIDAEIIAAGRSLKLIQRLGSAAWDIDLDAAKNAGVPVCYLPLASCQLVAEHLVLQMLATAKRVRELMQVVAEAGDWGVAPRRCTEDYYMGNWSHRVNLRDLRKSTVGIIGFGEIGGELVRRLRGFDCTLLYNKRLRLPARAEVELEITYATRDELTEQSDFVCSLLPFNAETEQSINRDFFGAMKRGAIFVHCGAGGIVDETALIDALRSGILAGAALDTYTYEPMRPSDPLLELACDPMQNLVLTPSIAAGTLITSGHPRAGDYGNIVALLEGKPLQYRLV